MTSILAELKLGEWGDFLVGIAAVLGIFWTIGGFVAARYIKDLKGKVLEATTASVQAAVAKSVAKEIEDRDPESYFTLDMRYNDGSFLVVPMIPWVPLMLQENIRIGVVDHHAGTATTLLLVCDGYGFMKAHHHDLTTETIKVLRGVVSCLETQKQYKSGDVWAIAPKEIHSAMFTDCVCLIEHKPSLPTAKQRPVDLSQMAKVFPPPQNLK